MIVLSKHLVTAMSAIVLLSAAGAVAAAPTVIDFDAVSLRGSNASNTLPTITEFANGNGASISSLVAGQKAYYGTSHFAGQTVSSIDTISFSYRPSTGLPYVNLGITNGFTTGVLALTTVQSSVVNGDGSVTVVYDLATTGLAFYERVGPDPVFGVLDYDDIDTWTFIVGDRTLAAGEANGAGQPRGPVSDSLAILWGDSQNNYLGEKEIFNVQVLDASGNAFVAGNVPEPASLALVGLALMGALVSRRRRRSA